MKYRKIQRKMIGMEIFLLVFEMLVADAVSATEFLFDNFNPALFQNVIMGILAVFIPFGLEILGAIRSTNQEKPFMKKILTDEVLFVYKTISVTVISLVVFSFLEVSDGNSISLKHKIIAFWFGMLSFVFLIEPLIEVLNFYRHGSYEFKKRFLKKLTLKKKVFKAEKIRVMEDMKLAWNFIWSENNIKDEKEFTKIFISHIDDLIKNSYYYDATSIFRLYLNNISNRADVWFPIYELYPKVLEWQKKFMKDKIAKKNHKGNHYPSWWFFQNKAMPAFIKLNTSEFGDFSSLFDITEKFIKKWDKDAKSKNERNLFSGFLAKFLNEIFELSMIYVDASEFFPNDWKIFYENSNNRVSEFVRDIFLQNPQVNKKIRNDEHVIYDENFSNLLQNIFPNMDGQYMSNFLWWIIFQKKEKILEKGCHFSFSHPLFGSSGTDFKQLEKVHIENTIKTICEYFLHVPILDWRDLLSNDERENWKKFTNDERNEIVKKLKIQKLNNHKQEFESIKLDEGNDSAKYRKEFYVEMIEKIIEEIKNH